MSYRITEAERKHVAVIEDLKLNLSVTAEEGTTPAVSLEITDSDKLNLSASFPQYAIDVDKTDDEHSRFRLVDAKTRETILTCDGLRSLNGNPLGLGWRYGLEFILDDDKYVKGISLINKNNGNKADKIITKLADMEIKSIVIPESDQIGLTVNAKALFTKAVTINTDSTDNALSVRNAKGKHATIGDVQFTDDTAIKTEGKTRLAEISTDDVELVNDESEVSITAQKSTFKDTEIELDRTVINGKGDSRINELKSLSSQNITGNNITTESLNATSISATSENVNSLEAGNANIDTAQIGVENVTSSNIETATIGSETAENLTVHQKARFEGDTYTRALDVDGKLIAGEIKSLSKVETTDLNSTNANIEDANISKAEVSELDVVTEKAASIETRNLTVTRQMDAIKVTSRTDIDAFNNVIAGNSVVTDKIEGKDGTILMDHAGDILSIGDGSDQTILKTVSDPSVPLLSNEHGHVKAIVDGKEVFLANLGDIQTTEEGYVNRSTNQSISGIKSFNDVIEARAGIGIKDEEGHLRGIISHVEDYSDVAYQQNPKYIEAKAEADAYDALYSQYEHLKADYTQLKTLERNLKNAEAAVSAAESNLAAQNTDRENLIREKAELTEQINGYENEVSDYETLAIELNHRYEELLAIVTAKSAAYEEAKSRVDNEIVDENIMKRAVDQTTYFGVDFDDSFLKDNEDYHYLMNGINYTTLTYDDAMAAFDKMISVLDILSGSTQENVVYYCNVTKENILNSLKPTIVHNHEVLVNNMNNALNDLNEARDNANSFKNNEIANNQSSIQITNNGINTLRSRLTLIDNDIATNDQEILEAKTGVQTAKENKAEAEVDYSRAKNTYSTSYKDYATKINFEYTEDDFENGVINSPEMSKLVKSFKANEIPQTYYGPSDTIYVGNSKDTLKLMSKGIASGDSIDQHVLATIDGHYHTIANTDDIIGKNVMKAFDEYSIDSVTGVQKVDKGKIVGDVKADQDENGEVSIVVGKAPVITGYEEQVFPEAQEAPSKIEEKIKLTSKDNSITISSVDNKIDFKVSDELVDKIIKSGSINGIKFDQSSLILQKGTGEEDELLFVSTNDDLTFEALSDNIMDVNVVNKFYNKDQTEKDDVLRLYDGVQPSHMNKWASAYDTKVLFDSVSARVDVLARNLEERLPVAPGEQGRFYLVANVSKNEKNETTATYTWDGTGTLPTANVITDVSESTSPDDFDADGNLYLPYEAPEYAEYSLKMRIIKATNAFGQTVYEPRVMWVRMDKALDYSQSAADLRNHPAVIKAINERPQSQTEEEAANIAINALISKIDTSADMKVTYHWFDLTNRSNDALVAAFLRTGYAKVSSTLADIVDFDRYNVLAIVEEENNATFASKVKITNGVTTVRAMRDILNTEITTPEEAANILLADESMFAIVEKNSGYAYIGD